MHLAPFGRGASLGCDGIYYQRYVVDVAANGRFSGTGTYVGFQATRAGATDGDTVPCGLTQRINGKVGAKANYVASYDPPEQAYWYDFKGVIDGVRVGGTGTNVNGQVFKIRTATQAELDAAAASC